MKVRFEKYYYHKIRAVWPGERGVRRGEERERELGEKARRPGNGGGWS